MAGNVLLPAFQGSFRTVSPHSTRVAVEMLRATLGNMLTETGLDTHGLRPFGVVCCLDACHLSSMNILCNMAIVSQVCSLQIPTLVAQ